MKKQTGTRHSSCGSCELEGPERICLVEDGKGAVGCPTLSRKEVLADANREFELPDTKEFARQASIQEAECYANRHQRPYIMQPKKTRLVEICEFSERMGYKRLGIAFCLGLRKEARTVSEILTGRGFDVVSTVCKAGRTPKELIGIRTAVLSLPSFEPGRLSESMDQALLELKTKRRPVLTSHVDISSQSHVFYLCLLFI